MSKEEIEQYLSQAHTVIVATNGPNGFPHCAPLWFVYMDGHIYFRTMLHLQKVKNIQRDDRVTCLVESGDRWVDLKAVMVQGRCQMVQDQEEIRRFMELFQSKYAAFVAPREKMPDRTAQHYSRPRCYFKVALEKVITWDNRKVRLRTAPAAGG